MSSVPLESRWQAGDSNSSRAWLWVLVGFVFACMILWRSQAMQWLWPRLHPGVLGTGYAACACLSMLLAPPEGKVFIYFDF